LGRDEAPALVGAISESNQTLLRHKPTDCNMDLRLEGKTVLVTGSSAGIGFATARQFLREGASVAICGRRPDRLEDAANELRAETLSRVEAVQADITDPHEAEQLVLEAERRLGGIDVLVNNAGTGVYKPFLEVTETELLNATQLNLFSLFRITQMVVRIMVRTGGGSIVNVTGVSGSTVLDPPFFSTCSSPTKAAQERLTKQLAMELGSANIRVNSVSPGRVRAPERIARWTRDIAHKEGAAAVKVEEQLRAWGQRISLPNNRWAEVEEIANLVVFVASPACAFMTGAQLVADGGESRN
jgi:3-oxoacyl-[acyl-carrier protein] reductase